MGCVKYGGNRKNGRKRVKDQKIRVGREQKEKSRRYMLNSIFVLNEIQTTMHNRGRSIHAAFGDFRKAFHSINRGNLYEAMEQLGIPMTEALHCNQLHSDVCWCMQMT